MSLLIAVLFLIGGLWVMVEFVGQLRSAARGGYVIAGIPKHKVYRTVEPRLFWVNVVLLTFAMPMCAFGMIVLLSRILASAGLPSLGL